MKRIAAIFLTVMLLFSLVACAENNSNTTGTSSTSPSSMSSPKKQYDNIDTNSIIAGITSAFESGIQSIKDESTVVYEKIGNTYKDYNENREAVTDFYHNTLATAEKLYDSISAASVDYFKCISTQGLDNYDTWNKAMDNFYDTWDSGMDDFYDTWDNIYDDFYEKCDNIIKSASDSLAYSEYSEAWSTMYEDHSNAWSAMYEAHSDNWSKQYSNYSSVWGGFYSDNSDVDAILKEAEEKEHENKVDGSESTTNSEKTDTNNSADNNDVKLVDGMRAEFKEAMDGYEAFYDEYCDFMRKYQANPTDLKLLAEYSEIVVKLADMDEKFDAWDENDLNDAELKYYIEVNNRITQKLLEVAQ